MAGFEIGGSGNEYDKYYAAQNNAGGKPKVKGKKPRKLTPEEQKIIQEKFNGKPAKPIMKYGINVPSSQEPIPRYAINFPANQNPPKPEGPVMKYGINTPAPIPKYAINFPKKNN